jgi:hypothetical protein
MIKKFQQLEQAIANLPATVVRSHIKIKKSSAAAKCHTSDSGTGKNDDAEPGPVRYAKPRTLAMSNCNHL